MHNENPLPKLYSAKEVAKATGLPLWRIYELTREGMIPHVSVGARYRYAEDQLLDWIRRGGTRSQTDAEA